MAEKRRVIFELLTRRIQKSPDQTYLRYRPDGRTWKEMSWREYGRRIDQFSRALIAVGVDAGDKVAIIGTSSPDWFVVDMSIMTIGAVTAPIYFTSSGEQIAYIVNHSDAKLFLVLSDEYVPVFKDNLKDMPSLENIVVFNGNTLHEGTDIMNSKQFLENADAVTNDELQKRRDAVTNDDVCTYIYTSGTTGPPKAVMLMQKNYYAVAKSVSASLRFLFDYVDTIHICCFLTLSHVFERSNALTAPLETGTIVHFGDISNALEDLCEIKPTIVVGLPRTWEKMHEAIMAKRDAMPGLQKKIFDWALKTGMEYNAAIYEKRNIMFTLKARHAIAKKLVIDKILAPLGFDNAKHFMTGGAVSSKEIVDFFFALGVWICQVYGQSEALGIGSIETREKRRFGSVGIPFPGVEVKIADDGEILIRGEVVSAGYFKDPELTAQTFQDGWLYTGDLGYVDEDGYLFITGRKKDIIITSGAKNITPAKIEASLMSSPLIEHAVVAGDGKKYLTALMTLNLEEGINYAGKKGIAVKTYSELFAVDGLQVEIQRHVNDINNKFSRVEQIKKFKILPQPLSADCGELTSLLKIKRYKVLQNYNKEVEQMYTE